MTPPKTTDRTTARTISLTDLLAVLNSTPTIIAAPRANSLAMKNDSQVTDLVFDSRLVRPGAVYVAIRGENVDGHAFLAAAATAGASALIVEDQARVPSGYPGAVVVVQESRKALNQLAARWAGDPAKRLFCVGVTGTNGKTTTSYLTETCLNAVGFPTGVVGTINQHLGSKIWPTEMTTPAPVEFHGRLADFLAAGARAVALEASSHALTQFRIDEVPLDVAQFTNLTRDHLDYHKDMESYFQAKLSLFTKILARSPKPSRYAIVNGDDPYGKRIPQISGATNWTYGCGKTANLRLTSLEQGFGGNRFSLDTPFGSQEFSLRMPGLHNVYNASAAVGAALAASPQFATLAKCQEALAVFAGVPGRLESVANDKGLYVFVDYAHTDDALRTVLHHLNAIRQMSQVKNKIITVFGCGGDRDRGKRPLMMKEAELGSDLCVVTSDNPRTEDPLVIIDHAVKGASAGSLGRTVFQEPDRKKAIARAIELAVPGDVILIAGKGHENYQQIGTAKYPFSDVLAAKELLS